MSTATEPKTEPKTEPSSVAAPSMRPAVVRSKNQSTIEYARHPNVPGLCLLKKGSFFFVRMYANEAAKVARVTRAIHVMMNTGREGGAVPLLVGEHIAVNEKTGDGWRKAGSSRVEGKWGVSDK